MRMVYAVTTLALVLAAAWLGWGGPDRAPASVSDGDDYSVRIKDDRIREASGIVASRSQSNSYYVHNDSGDTARVFLVARDGGAPLEITLAGATAADYEDIAWAPNADGKTFDICVADIGDNACRRESVTIYRFPDAPVLSNERRMTVTPTACRARYPDGAHNAEAFVVDPLTGDGYILTKELSEPFAVYRLAAPWPTEKPAEMEKIATVELPTRAKADRLVTGADISPDGRRLAVRTYAGGWEWTLTGADKRPPFARFFDAAPTPMRLATEKQGEALAYATDGERVVTISEGAPVLNEVRLPKKTAAK